MAGTDARFPAAKFRTAIKNAMRMGAPEDTNKRVTFHWRVDKTFQRKDSGGDPISWTATPVTVDNPPDVQVDCSLTFTGQKSGTRTAPDGTAVAEFDTTHGVITLLDVDYAQIFSGGRRADQVVIDRDTYDIQFVAAPYALFDVTCYDLHIESVDES